MTGIDCTPPVDEYGEPIPYRHVQLPDRPGSEFARLRGRCPEEALAESLASLKALVDAEREAGG